MRRWAPWIALVLVAVGGLAFGLHRSSSHPTINQEVLQIAGEVRCPVCNGETAAQSQAAASVQIRAQILRELQSGETKDQILDGLVQAYGTGILEKPQPTGVGLVVWVVPVVAILVAAGVLGLAFVRWRAKAAADGSDSSGAMDTLPGPERVRDGTGCPARIRCRRARRRRPGCCRLQRSWRDRRAISRAIGGARVGGRRGIAIG